VWVPGSKVGSYADIHSADARSDLAVLKLLDPPPKMKAIKFGDVRTYSTRREDATIRTGTLVVLMVNAYSSTFGVDQPSATFGSITNVRRITPPDGDSRRARYTEFGTLLEYNVKANAGVTGGALLNLSGELIGMTNAGAVAFGQDIGSGYAMPADEHFQRIVEVLLRGEEVEYGFLGVRPIGRRNTIRPGSPVVDVMPDSAAEQGGMRTGDMITEIDGAPIESFDDLQLRIGSALAGSKVRVTVLRGGRPVELIVTLSKLRNTEPFIASVRPEPVFGLRVDYGSLLTQDVDPRGPQRPLLSPGVSVREVAADSPAEKQFKTLGDTPATSWLITRVNGVAVGTPAAFYKAAKGHETLKLSLVNPADRSQHEITIP
jgi:serine protease Do